MIATLIAYTVINEDAIEALNNYKLHGYQDMVAWADELAEFAGRACYESWDRPNVATATNDGYLKSILQKRHFSVMEHASASFYLVDVARSFTHELIRHRHMSYSQLSQRYVDESEANFVLPPGGDDWEAEQIRLHHANAKKLYARLVEHRLADGQTRKQAREAARAVLLNATETRVLVTGNMRAWREVIEKRTGVGVDRAFDENAREILRQLKGLAPNTFQDMPL